VNKFPNHQSDKNPGNYKPTEPMIMVVDDEDSAIEMKEVVNLLQTKWKDLNCDLNMSIGICTGYGFL
jgi:hypothetical protein